MNQEMINALINKNANIRYEYFIKKIADTEIIFSLNNQGFALYGGEDNKVYFPLWSDLEFAELCLRGDFSEYKVVEINLDDFIDNYLENLRNDNIELVIFPTQKDNGVCIDIKKFKADIESELEKY